MNKQVNNFKEEIYYEKHKKIYLGSYDSAMVSAIAPMGAFAADGDPTTVNQDSTTKAGTMTATYDVQAKYTVTIPKRVLGDTVETSASVVAENVMLESGQNIVVKLTNASNTESGSTFNAKNDSSTATYTIGKGTEKTGIAVGDTVATFRNRHQKTGTETHVLQAKGATYAGEAHRTVDIHNFRSKTR